MVQKKHQSGVIVSKVIKTDDGYVQSIKEALAQTKKVVKNKKPKKEEAKKEKEDDDIVIE